MPAPDKNIIKSIIEKSGEACRILCLEETDSTNLEGKRQAVWGGELPLLIAADSQTAGRGRLGRSFYSPESTGVYMSLVLPAAECVSSVVTVTTAAAVAVRRAILKVTGVSTGIKWVNDLYAGGLKVCGILAESTAGKNGLTVIVGVGINVNTEAFPKELYGIAGSLSAGDVRDKLIGEAGAELLKIMKEPPEKYMDEYRQNSLVLGRDITFTGPEGEAVPARAEAIDHKGGLVVRLQNGEERTLFTGEISVRLR